jgi:hypothetical protein
MTARNAVRCDQCGDEIESKYQHDFVTCRCGDVSVDGGGAYMKRAFKAGATWTELPDGPVS